jgi:hypothetical protein
MHDTLLSLITGKKCEFQAFSAGPW